MIRDFKQFILEMYPGAKLSLISTSNSYVIKVTGCGTPKVAKLVLDEGIPTEYFETTSHKISQNIKTQKIIKVIPVNADRKSCCIIAEYVDGNNLSSVLEEKQVELNSTIIAEYLIEFIKACSNLPPYFDGFGLYKTNRLQFDSYRDFILFYANQYWSRVRPFILESDKVEAIDDWIKIKLFEALKNFRGNFCVAAIDANLKNFLISDKNKITLLNVPIIGKTSKAHAIGAISAHLRNTKIYDNFINVAKNDLIEKEIALLPHFEAWTLLGILSFYAKRKPERIYTCKNWGAPVSLFRDFLSIIN